jgi:hypothetical protein
MAHGGLLLLCCNRVCRLLFPDYQNKVLTMAQPFVWGDVATMLRLVIMGAKEKSLTAGSAEAAV